MNIGPIEHKTNIRFKNMNDFGSYLNAIDIDYDSEDVIFTGYVFKLKTPQFNVVRRSAYGRGTNYMQEYVESHGQNCYIPTSGMCFIKCINYFTKKDDTEKFLYFIRSEQRRSNVKTSARIQPFLKNIISTSVVLMGREEIHETLLEETHHCSYIIIISV